ncbi:MAG: DMT family transporter [Bacteroidetes bacterium]|nr:DMT family transporter [Bacteroidota bacterium]
MFGELLALLTAFLWSGTSIAFTEASRRIGSLQLNITRMMLASVILFFIITIAGFSFDISNTQLYFLIASGFAGLVFGDSFLFKSFQTIGARLGMLLMALVPAFSTILAYVFLNENLSSVAIAGIVITIAGIVIVILDRSGNSKSVFQFNKSGLLYGVFGAFGQASGLILAKSAFEMGEVNGFVAAFIRIVASVIIIFPIVVLLKRFKNPFTIFKNDFTALKATVTGTILGPVLGITSSLIAISYAKIGIASTLMSTMPIIMLPMAKFYYKETLSRGAISGAFVAVVGVAILLLL